MKRDFSKDILICVKRLFIAEETIRKWLTTGAGIPFEHVHNCYKLEGYEPISLPPHPIISYNDKEKDIFLQCFGNPFSFPKKFSLQSSWKDEIEKIKKRREFLRETIAMTKDSQFRNYQTQKKKSDKYETNTRASGNRAVRDTRLERTRNDSARNSRKKQSKGRIRKYPKRR